MDPVLTKCVAHLHGDLGSSIGSHSCSPELYGLGSRPILFGLRRSVSG
jgi:hypothetical protein